MGVNEGFSMEGRDAKKQEAGVYSSFFLFLLIIMCGCEGRRAAAKRHGFVSLFN